MIVASGCIPTLLVRSDNLAAAWEASLLSVYSHGCLIKTEYDKKEDPSSKDCTMIIEIAKPLSEPMIHLDFPGGPEDLQEYTLEVTEGIKDHWTRPEGTSEIDDTRWEYTYHQRFADYTVPGLEDSVDQIECMIRKLANTPYTRRAQIVTWKPWIDNDCSDPACLQSIWCRCLPDFNGVLWLNMNVRIRSNDAYKASFMNMFAFIQFQKMLVEMLGLATGRDVRVGRYVHMADSYHIYGSYMDEFESRFLSAIKNRTFEQRSCHYADWRSMMEEAIPSILRKAKEQTPSKY